MRNILQIVSAARSLFIPRPETAVDEQALLHAIYESAPIGIAIADPQGRLLRANPAYRRMTGFSEDELRAETLHSLTHPEDFPLYHSLLQELQDGRRESFRLVSRYRTKPGPALWARNTVSLLRLPGDARPSVIIRAEDITERRQKKGLLRGQAEPFRLLVESVADFAIFILDTEGRVASWNMGAERIKGYREEEIVGQHFSRFYPQEEVLRGKPARELRDALEHGRFEEEGWRLRKDGSAFWANVTITPMRDEEGNLHGFAKVTSDLTERKRTQEALRASEKSFRDLVEVLPIAVYVCDSSGSIESHNRYAVELWGDEPAREQGASLFCGVCHICAPDGARVRYPECPMSEVLRTGRPITDREVEILRHDGTRRTAIASIIPRRDENGVLTGSINCLMDITERKHAEHALKQYAEQLRVLSSRMVELHEQGRQALSRELHDRVGQNLAALNINLGIILEELPDEVKHLVEARLVDSQELVEATVDTITDVMADLRPPLLDDYGLLTALRFLADQFSIRSGVAADVRGPMCLDRLPQQVEISLYRIAQEALTNLAKHAQADHVLIELAESPDQIILTITDDGIGFIQGDKTEANDRPGWGMLTMRERAVALGGSLAIESAPGRGTRVTAAITR